MAFIFVFSNVVTAQDVDGDGVTDNLDLDNDNDGVLDYNEGYCNTSFDYINNGSFEEYTTPPNGLGQINEYCDFWSQANIATSDYLYDGVYSYDGFSPPPAYDGNGFLNSLSQKGGGYTEYIANQLASPLVENSTYTMRIALGAMNESSNFGGAYNGEFVVYGLKEEILLPLNTPNTISAEPSLAQEFQNRDIVELVRVNIDIAMFDWDEFTFTFSVDQHYERLILGGENSPVIGATTYATLLYDNVRLTEVCSSIDTDMDGTADYLDTDSDNDGCADALEGSGNYTLTDLTSSNNLSDNDEGTVDSNGIPNNGGSSQVQASSLAIVTATEYVINQTPIDKLVTSGNSTTFSIAVSATSTQSFTGTVPNTVPDYTDISVIDVGSGINYQWFVGDPEFDGAAILASDANYNGEITDTLTVNDVAGLDGTVYFVVVTHDNNKCLNTKETGTLTVNAAPSTNDVVNTAEIQLSAGITLLDDPTGTDIDGTVVSYRIISLPENGLLSLSNGTVVTANTVLTKIEADGLTFDPDGTTANIQSFTLAAIDNDNAEDASPASFTINLNLGVNENGYTTGAFVTTWKTDNLGASDDTSITIPTTGAGYNYDVDWDGDGIFDEFGITGNATHDYGRAGTYTVQIKGDFPRIYFNNDGDKEKLLRLEQWGAGSWKSMSVAFYGCLNLTISAVDAPDLSLVDSMSFMFANAANLNSNIGFWDVSKVSDMAEMFSGAVDFDQNIGSWDVSNVTLMENIFFEAGLSSINYDALLNGWSALGLQNSVSFNGGSSIYCEGAEARQNIIDTYEWMIVDAGECDNDNDGVINSEDECPNTPTGEPVDENGCSETQRDADGDGISDDEDVFPNNADEFEDTDDDGTGDNEDLDDDNDGYSDEIEITEGTNAKNANDFPLDSDQDGIPNSIDTDDDNDGVLDTSDSFPTTVEPFLIPAEAFTPNGDGINDTWIVPGINNYPNNVVRVYNRWGHEVFIANNYQNDWTGRHNANSTLLPTGSYLYIVNLGNGTDPLKGWIFINY
ncbi:gliding motility-associated C-terminal domain-containing protein [Maribacter sp. ACAM166]|uniref:T9SS type B sorting domain-containing protein n=1 Tax=Maribacter sp. ACAM166 TaxID=2508996 RepID=UPI0014852C54|nr:gliding motility-associated C-terminal domain-containing protein [Maribacter sp. ACAM166]